MQSGHQRGRGCLASLSLVCVPCDLGPSCSFVVLNGDFQKSSDCWCVGGPYWSGLSGLIRGQSSCCLFLSIGRLQKRPRGFLLKRAFVVENCRTKHGPKTVKVMISVAVLASTVQRPGEIVNACRITTFYTSAPREGTRHDHESLGRVRTILPFFNVIVTIPPIHHLIIGSF